MNLLQTSLVIGALLLGAKTFAQPIINTYGDNPAFGHEPSDLLQTADGGFLLIGDVNSSAPLFENYFSFRYLVKTDELGDTSWTKYYNQSWWGEPKVLEDGSGGYTAFGEYDGGNSCNGGGSTIAYVDYATQGYSALGDVTSEVISTDTCDDDIEDMMINSSGNIMALMKHGGFGAGITYYGLKEMSPGGSITNTTLTTTSVKLIEEAPNGYWLARQNLLYKVDFSGTTLWDSVTVLPSSVTDFCATGSDSLMWLCSPIGDSISVVKTDSVGTVEWIQKFDMRGRQIMRHSSGNYIITGEQGVDMAILVIDENGNELEMKVHTIPPSSRGHKTIEISEGIATLGRWGGFGEPRSFVLVIDQLNIVSVPNPERPLTGVTIFPNPSNGTFHLKFEEEIQFAIDIIVYNSMGQLIYRAEMESGLHDQQIDLSEFTSGIYRVQLITESGSVVKQIIKK